MNIPANLAVRSLLLPSRSSLRALGAAKFGFLSISKQQSRLGAGFSKKMEAVMGTELAVVCVATDAHAEEAIEAIKTGKVIAVPTDTLYGFACDACSSEAFNSIYEIKGRKHTSPLAICDGDVSYVQRFVVTDHLPDGLLGSLLPAPVTVVLRRRDLSIIDQSLNQGLDSIGVRVPGCDFIRVIARGSETALALTSANLSGQPSSVCIKDFENLCEHCGYVYDGGVLPSGRAGSINSSGPLQAGKVQDP